MGRIETFADGSTVDINAASRIEMAGMTDAQGTGSSIDITTERTFDLQLLAGNLIARGEDALIQVTADESIAINGAIQAGTHFEDDNGTPVAVKDNEGADVIINAANTIRVGGTITTSDQMVLNGTTETEDDQFFLENYYNGEIAGNQGFILTGTLTSLADNTELAITSDQDVVIEGNINVNGANSDLRIESGERVYLRTFTNVQDDITILAGQGEANEAYALGQDADSSVIFTSHCDSQYF